MAQNLISLNLSDADYAEIDTALMGKGSGLEALRKSMSMRFARNSQGAAAGEQKAA